MNKISIYESLRDKQTMDLKRDQFITALQKQNQSFEFKDDLAQSARPFIQNKANSIYQDQTYSFEKLAK